MAGYDKSYLDMVAAKRAARANRPPPEPDPGPEPEPDPEPQAPDAPVGSFTASYPKDGGGAGPS